MGRVYSMYKHIQFVSMLEVQIEFILQLIFNFNLYLSFSSFFVVVAVVEVKPYLYHIRIYVKSDIIIIII